MHERLIYFTSIAQLITKISLCFIYAVGFSLHHHMAYEWFTHKMDKIQGASTLCPHKFTMATNRTFVKIYCHYIGAAADAAAFVAETLPQPGEFSRRGCHNDLARKG